MKTMLIKPEKNISLYLKKRIGTYCGWDESHNE
jgi:hypothetical protein